MPRPGRSIVVTGASSGIGRELAHVLAERGARLTLAARNAETLDEVVGECAAAGGSALAAPTDVTDPASCRRLVDRALERWGQIDGLVNNAGLTMWARFDEIEDLSIFERLMRVNYLGAVYCTHYALPHLKQRDGMLVAVSSLAGKAGVPTRSAYAASKHALQGFMDSIRVELRNTGVDVLVASPGFVRTPIRERGLDGSGQPHGTSPRDESQGGMTARDCAERIARAMDERRRELVMTAQGRLGPWMQLVAPSVVDHLAARAVGDPGRAPEEG